MKLLEIVSFLNGLLTCKTNKLLAIISVSASFQGEVHGESHFQRYIYFVSYFSVESELYFQFYSINMITHDKSLLADSAIPMFSVAIQQEFFKTMKSFREVIFS